MYELAEWSTDRRARRHITAVPYIPDPDESQFRVEPRVLWNLRIPVAVLRLQRDLRVKVQVQVIRCRQEDLTVVDLQLSGFVPDSRVFAFDLADGRDIAGSEAVEEQYVLGVGDN